MSEIGADKLAKIYIKMRDKLQQLDREHEELLKTLLFLL